MRLYPELPGDRARAIIIDVVVLLLLWACVSVGVFVHDAVSELDALGRGVERAGTQVQDSFSSAADRVDGIPLVGGDLGEALEGAGRRTGEPVVDAGTSGRDAVADLALLLGLVTGGLPALVILAPFVPWRVIRARRLLSARRVFDHADSPERQRLLAMRAAFNLPLGTLLRHTADPLGDLEAGRLAPLLAALGDEYGLRAPQPAQPSVSARP